MKLKLDRVGPVGNDFRETVDVEGRSSFEINAYGSGQSFPLHSELTNFALLPAASVAVGSDKLVTVDGEGTQVIARHAAGGAQITTKSSTPAAEDDAFIAAVAAAFFRQPIRGTSGLRFETRVNLPSIEDIFASVGLNENITDVDPAGTAGEGAMFLFDPDAEITTGLAAAAHDNWILAHKVDGADTFADSGVEVREDEDYELGIHIDASLMAHFTINGVEVGVGPALTADDNVSVFGGIEKTDTAGQKSMIFRFLRLGRNIG